MDYIKLKEFYKKNEKGCNNSVHGFKNRILLKPLAIKGGEKFINMYHTDGFMI